jgi:hypothetical protein
MSGHRDDVKFDSQKLIQLRTFNWCATSHDGYLSKDGTIRRTDTSRYALSMRITWHGTAKCGTGRQLGMIPKFF